MKDDTMDEVVKNTKARFWKCALQVNPASYAKFRGEEQPLSEAEYNLQIAQICKEEGIEVIGIADHGNVEGVDAMRKILTESGIVVFPGFEIASSEKVHFVCLFPEATTTDVLNRFLGSLDLLDPEDGVRPSKLGGEALLQKIEAIGGFAYAAHCIDASGLLKGSFNHIWKSPKLKAVQIKGTVDDLKEVEGGKFYQILKNKNVDYKRDIPVAILNARDIERPETLRDTSASCLVRMTQPCFDSFKQAFLEPEYRIRLLGDRSEKYFSAIESIKFTGGYLDGLDVELSENLNAVIGGRGTGKSTLVECLRYAFDLKPLSKNAQKSHDEIVKTNLGRGSMVEVILRSAAMNGRRFRIRRKYGEAPVVHESPNKLSTFSPAELLPKLEIYGQNEIYEIAQDDAEQTKLLGRFIGGGSGASTLKYQELTTRLHRNRLDIQSAFVQLGEVEQEVARLPKLQEQVAQFASLGLDEKLKAVPLWEREKLLGQRFSKDVQGFSSALNGAREALPDIQFLSDSALQGLPHSKELKSLRQNLISLLEGVAAPFATLDALVEVSQNQGVELVKILDEAISKDEGSLSKTFSEIPSVQGRTGREIGQQYRALQEDIVRIQPKAAEVENRKAQLAELRKQRRELLAERSTLMAERSAEQTRAAKLLNRRLEGNLRITLNPESDRSSLMTLLESFKMEGIGTKRLECIQSAESLSPMSLADAIRSGVDVLKAKGWEITESVVTAFSRLSESQLMQIEEVAFGDAPLIELNVGHGEETIYRSISQLSKGQQCTAILHLLLLRNQDPLVMDQPEDNLDNAFIAERIVTELRKAKFERQFLFATHNANIPVFGDAEWIGVFQVNEGTGSIPKDLQGAIDLPQIQTWASDILEGGKIAFMQRKEKYHF
jgi:energy-coupling factor transporter ATP-binding protein EcfA2